MHEQAKRGVRYKAGPVSRATTPAEDTRRELIRQTRTIARLEQRRRQYKRKVAELTKELRARRRGLKMLLAEVARQNQPFEYDSAERTGPCKP